MFAKGNCGRCPHGAKAHAQLKGFENDGSTFRTARCKIYPEGLNQALADAILTQAAKVYAEVRVSPELPQDFLPFNHVNFVGSDVVQPDFYRPIVQS